MRFIFQLALPFFVIAFCCCSTAGKQTHPQLEYVESELAARRVLLSNDSLFADSINAIQKKVSNLCFLSIDVENLSACITKSNTFFVTTSKAYGLDTLGYFNLYKGLPLSEFELTIRKNELCLLNKMIISRNKNNGLMLTAQ